MRKYFTSRTANGRARSWMTLIGSVVGFGLGCALIMPLQGASVIGPWLIMALGAILGAVVGALLGPVASPLFRENGAFVERRHRLSAEDPVTGRKIGKRRKLASYSPG